MIRLYPLVLILQAFCIYHAYTHKINGFWYFLIIFFPVIGSCIYLYKFIYSKEKISTISEEIKEVVVPKYKENQLTRKLNHTDTIQNKMRLAEEYYFNGDYQDSINLYESCLTTNSNDPAIFKKLVLLKFYNKEYKAAIEYGEKLIGDTFFKNDEERIALAWAYFEDNQIEKADETFQDMNSKFSNYIHRLEYASFLRKTNKLGQAKSILETMLAEFERMEKSSKRQKKSIHSQIQQMYREV